MKKKFFGMFFTFMLMCAFPAFVSAAPSSTIETTNILPAKITAGYGHFFANGTPITIEARTDGNPGALIKWNGGSLKVGPKTIVFGGSHDADVDSSSITMNGGTVLYVFGGGLHDAEVKNAEVTINGGTATYVVGGGASTAAWTSCTNIVTELSVAAAKNKVASATTTINGGNIQLVYGGGEGLAYVGAANVFVKGGTIGYLTAGGSNGITENTQLVISGGEVDVYQSVNRGVVNKVDTVVSGGEIDNFYVGGETGDASVNGSVEAAKVTIVAGKVNNLSNGTTGENKTPVVITGAEDEVAVVYGEGTVTTDTTGAATEIILVSLDKETLAMAIGEKATLNAILKDKLSGKNISDNTLVKWISTDENIVTVDENGNLVSKKAGKATITAELGDKVVKCEITVEDKKASESKLDDVPKTGNSLPILLVALVVLASVTGAYSVKSVKARK